MITPSSSAHSVGLTTDFEPDQEATLPTNAKPFQLSDIVVPRHRVPSLAGRRRASQPWNAVAGTSSTPSLQGAESLSSPPAPLSPSSSISPSSPSSFASTPPTSAASSCFSSLPPSPLPSTSTAVSLLDRISTTNTSTSYQGWASDDFSLSLIFTASGKATDRSAPSLPPAFFPSARIYFSPKLTVHVKGGIPFSNFGGIQLGVTGMCEILDQDGKVTSKRMVADFTTDLTAGLAIWKRDAAGANPSESEDQQVYHQGSYVLPLSMKFPQSERLPPSCETGQFRISYTMSVAIFSTEQTSYKCPRQLKVYSVPFHILPSTLPTPPPELPFITHEARKGIFTSLFQSLPFSSPKPKADLTAYHLIFPELPTSNFSPASHANIPLTLRIVDRPIEKCDYFVRVALVRRLYTRESTKNSMLDAIEEDGIGGLGISPTALGVPEDVLVEPWCREEEEIVSRWGWIPYDARNGADPTLECSVVLKDIKLPLSGLNGNDAEEWKFGYSTALDIEPSLPPNLTHGDSSWFSSAFRSRPPITKEYSKHLHCSSRFFIVVKVGISTTPLKELFRAISSASPDLKVPLPNSFTPPFAGSNSFSRHSGASLSDPFPSATPSSSSSTRSRKSSTAPSTTCTSFPSTPRTSTSSLPSGSGTSPFNLLSPSFPGKMRELILPITIGSVAEPGMECLLQSSWTSTGVGGAGGLGMQEPEEEMNARRIERRDREDRGELGTMEERFAVGDEETWICAPPSYEEGIKSVPAYLG